MALYSIYKEQTGLKYRALFLIPDTCQNLVLALSAAHQVTSDKSPPNQNLNVLTARKPSKFNL